MSKLKRRIRQAAARGVYVIRWPDDGRWDVYVEAETLLGPRGVTHTKRASVNFAYRIAMAGRQQVVAELPCPSPVVASA